MTFEWFMGGLMDFSDDDVQPAKYNFNHQMKMVYDLATGVLQGFRMESFIDGKNNGKDIILELGYLCEIEGYNMPDFNFTPLVDERYFVAILCLKGRLSPFGIFPHPRSHVLSPCGATSIYLVLPLDAFHCVAMSSSAI